MLLNIYVSFIISEGVTFMNLVLLLLFSVTLYFGFVLMDEAVKEYKINKNNKK